MPVSDQLSSRCRQRHHAECKDPSCGCTCLKHQAAQSTPTITEEEQFEPELEETAPFSVVPIPVGYRRSHLVIGDPHAHPGYSNERFTALGNFIADKRPDVIVCIGDMADMPSLCAYEIGKTSYEGRRYKLDIEAVIDAQEKLFAPIKEYRRRSHRLYEPQLDLVLGNHEFRIIRAVEDEPKLEGIIGIEDLCYEKYGWRVHPFLSPINIDSINYCHFYASGVAGRPISGKNIARRMCNELHESAVQGHSHVFDLAECSLVSGRKIFGLSCGCYTHPNMIESWNAAFHHLWWRGIVLLEDCDGAGYYDAISAITERKLLQKYL